MPSVDDLWICRCWVNCCILISEGARKYFHGSEPVWPNASGNKHTLMFITSNWISELPSHDGHCTDERRPSLQMEDADNTVNPGEGPIKKRLDFHKTQVHIKRDRHRVPPVTRELFLYNYTIMWVIISVTHPLHMMVKCKFGSYWVIAFPLTQF